MAIIALVAAARVIQFKTLRTSSALTYTMNYHYDRSWWVGHLWSLSVEEQFYAIAICRARRALWVRGPSLLAPMTRSHAGLLASLERIVGEPFQLLLTPFYRRARGWVRPWLREQRPFRHIASPGLYVIPARVHAEHEGGWPARGWGAGDTD